MSLDWKTLKSVVGLTNASLAYIGDEGKEIVIECDCQFQDALKRAKQDGNRLKFIICQDAKENTGNGDASTENTMIKTKSNDNSSSKYDGSTSDAAPEWFKEYMKRFEKDLSDLKSHVRELSLEKEKKHATITRYEGGKEYCYGRNLSLLLGFPTKSKKKVSEKDFDLLEHRDVKPSKKMEKGHGTKLERLEKLDNKTRVLLEEKRRLLEKKRHTKPKSDKGCCPSCEKKFLMKKSVGISHKDLGFFLPPGSKFTVYLTLENTGNVRWNEPQLRCFECFGGMEIKDKDFYLPRLNPTESCFFAVSGKVPTTPGFCYAKFAFLDGVKLSDSHFTCWAKVLADQPDIPAPKSSTEVFCNPEVGPDSAGPSMDFGNNSISMDQEKVDEDVGMLEKKLHDLELLQPEYEDFTYSGKDKKSHYNFVQEFQKNLKIRKARLAQNSFFDEPIQMDLKMDKQTSTEVESEASSDSELSILCMTQEEDNFFMVPSRSPSPAESVNEEKKFLNEFKTDNKTAEQPTGVKRHSVSYFELQKESEKHETAANENPRPSQGSPVRGRRSPLGEGISKPKKMKSKSTEYCFTTANLTHPTFTQVPQEIFVKPNFKFTAGQGTEKKMKFETRSGRHMTGERAQRVAQELKRVRVPQMMDSSGRMIYAVNSKGFCFPVEDLLNKRNWPEEEEPLGSSPGCSGIQNNERPNTSPAVNILPNVLMNGASNVASLAFNTAKSVINNLQSAFVTEGKTEMGETACEDKNVSEDMKLLLNLLDMGFFNLETNRKLLQIHDNDLSKVVEELINMQEKPSETP